MYVPGPLNRSASAANAGQVCSAVISDTTDSQALRGDFHPVRILKTGRRLDRARHPHQVREAPA
jgi:hypothetical protein